MNNTEILKNCPICKGDKIKFILKQEEFIFSQCQNCNVLFQSKRPLASEIMNYYKKDYQPYKSDYNFFARLFIKIRTLLEVKKFNKLLSFKRRCNNVKVLEIGCARGDYIKSLKDYGKYKVIGVEPDKHSCDFAKEKYNLEIYNGELLSQNFSSNSFDIVIMNHVIEHLYNPLEIIKEIYRILKLNGLLVVKTPDFNVLERKIFKKYWFPYEIPRHIILFSEKILKKILFLNNFKLVKSAHEKTPNNIILSINNIYKNNFFSINNYLLLILFLPFSFLLGLFKQSGRMVLILRKYEKNI